MHEVPSLGDVKINASVNVILNLGTNLFLGVVVVIERLAYSTAEKVVAAAPTLYLESRKSSTQPK